MDNIKACVDDEGSGDANLNTYLSDLVKAALVDVCTGCLNRAIMLMSIT